MHSEILQQLIIKLVILKKVRKWIIFFNFGISYQITAIEHFYSNEKSFFNKKIKIV